MNKDQLKELVKQHFNLVDYSETVTEKTEEKFGELYDENKAFKIVFPGDTLKVGDEVKVVTTDGQESLAPDGYHKLEDGTMIKTEGSSVVEIVNPETEKREEEMAENPGLAAKNEEEIASEKVGFAGPKADISNVEGTTAQNATTDVNGALKAMGETVAEMQNQVTGLVTAMSEMKAKFEGLASEPAASKTMASAGKTKMDSFSTATNDTAIKMARELMKNKNK
jgi:hypothetical protein